MNDNMHTGPAGLALIKEFEGYLTKLPNGDCQAYLDRLPNPDVWTIGWGCTHGVHEGLVWTKEEATKALQRELLANEDIVKKVITVPLNQNEFDALNSVCYNLKGGLNMRKTPSLINAVNSGDKKRAAEAFMLYNRSGGVPINGLTRRRAAEKELFLKPVKKEIINGSTKLRSLKSIRDGITASLPAGGVLDYLGYMEPIKTFFIENPYKIVAASLVVIWLLSKWIETKSVKDAEEGRYIPSKLAEPTVAPKPVEPVKEVPDAEPTS